MSRLRHAILVPLVVSSLLSACSEKSEETPKAASRTTRPRLPNNALQQRVRELSANEKKETHVVSASSGPIGISLEVFATEIEASEPIGFRITLTNLGKEPLFIAEKSFLNVWEMIGHATIERGVYLEALGPDGSALPTRGQMVHGPDLFDSEREEPPDPIEVARFRAMTEEWQRQGLTSEQIKAKLLEDSSGTEPRRKPVAILLPGKSLLTKPWFYRHEPRKLNAWQPPWGNKEFAELAIFWMDSPGRYKLRAVYSFNIGDRVRELTEELERSDNKNTRWLLDVTKELAGRSTPSDVTVRTPWIEIRVQP